MERDIDDTKDEAVNVDIYLLDKNEFTPKHATSGASGVDLRSIYNYTIKPNTSALIETGLSLGFPNGYEIQIRSINDLVLKHSVVVLNQTSTIGSDYEVVVLLANFGSNEIEIKAGDIVAQAVLRKKVEKINFTIF